jgi:hypothetical protein
VRPPVERPRQDIFKTEEQDMFSNSPMVQSMRKGFAGSAYLIVTVAAVTAIAAVILTTLPATTKPHPHDFATTAVLP